MNKGKMLVLAIFASLLLMACGAVKPAEVNTVSVDKKGNVTGTIVEDFSQDYYNADELNKMIDDEVASFNQKSGADHVAVSSYNAEEGKVSLVLTYASYDDYANFNEETFFVGTVSQAYDAGYTFADVKSVDGQDSLSKDKVLEKGTSQIMICEAAQNYVVPGKITYVSDNVTINDKKSVTVADDGEIAYILYE